MIGSHLCYQGEIMIRLYTVKDSYIDYLRLIEPKVLFNKDERRPYVGIVCVVNESNDAYITLLKNQVKERQLLFHL